MSNKAEAVSHTLAEILSDEVVLSVANHDVWNISFDKNPSKVICCFDINCMCILSVLLAD